MHCSCRANQWPGSPVTACLAAVTASVTAIAIATFVAASATSAARHSLTATQRFRPV